MGIFVTNSMIGIYQVSWTLAMTFQIIGQSIGRNLFPEISENASAENHERIRRLAKQSFVFGGLLPIPGIVGAAILGERVLGIYGAEFRSGAPVLVILAVVSLIRAYEGSVYALANGINEPRISFISDLLFIVANVLLNIVLVSYYGILGAATATAVALTLSLGVATKMVQSQIRFAFPVIEVAKQIGAALIMGTTVWAIASLLEPLSFIELLLLVTFGATLYFSMIVGVSEEVRGTAFKLAA